MLSNYIKIALRNLLRHPGYASINVFGFAVGLACCLFIVLYVQYELSYDRHHEHADTIYRITLDAHVGGQEIIAPLSAPPLASSLINDFPEVEQATRIFRSMFVGDEEVAVEYKENQFIESYFFYVDSTFFDVFTYDVLQGETDDLLTEPNTVVITRSTAKKYFAGQQPIGEVLRVNNHTEFRVVAVVEDPPAASHFRFDFLASLVTLPFGQSTNWFTNPFSTYFVLNEDADLELLEAKLAAFVKAQVAPQMKDILGVSLEDFLASGGRYQYGVQPLTDIHLHSNLSYELLPNSDIRYVYTFSIIAALILLIASFNFMNLATARSANRSREVGVRKVLGSNRHQLVLQFLMESVFMCILAMSIAVSVVASLLPVFNTWLGIDIALPMQSLGFIGLLSLSVLAVAVMSGLYPAFYLTAFRPASVLKGALKTGVKSGRLRSGLVITQFMISIVLMTTTGLVYQQMQFVQNKKLGFDQEHVLILDRGATATNQNAASFKRELENLPDVVAAAGLDNVPGKIMNDDVFKIAGSDGDDLKVLWVMHADGDIVETLDIQVTMGEAFNRDASRDSLVLILNETAESLYAWDYPIGQKLESPFVEPDAPPRVYDVAGVVEDFHFQSLHESIKPLAIELTGQTDLEYMAIRIAPGSIPDAMAAIESTWNTFYPGEPFSVIFLDEQVNQLYRTDIQHGQLLSLFAGLAIFIACLGLFGLAAYMTEQRIKEVGVRKVLGASVSSIVVLFSRDFLKRVLIAIFIGIPISYYAMEQWLDRFAYRTDISWEVFVIPGALALLITLGTISYHAIRAAFLNPVDTLKYE